MKIGKKKLITIAAILLLTISGLMATIPNAFCANQYTRQTKAYLSVSPSVIGLNQPLTVNLWVYPSPAGPHFSGGVALQDFFNISVTFTRPDGTTDTFMPTDGSGGGLIPGESESIGAIWFYYTPNQVGTWSVQFTMPQQMYDDKPSTNDTVIYQAATSQATTFKVQQDVVRIGLDPVALPTGYWTYPVNSNNREWYTIAGAWLQNVYDASTSSFNPYAVGPKSPHILWTNQVEFGGMIGGDWGSMSYDDAVGGNPPIIMLGKVYYNMPGTQFRCVDLATGNIDWTASGSLTLAQNLKAATRDTTRNTTEILSAPVSPILWNLGSTSWTRYNPLNGAVIGTITNVPSGLSTKWYDGSPVVFGIRQVNWNTTIPNRLAQNELIRWDFTRVVNNNWMTGVVWNVSLKTPEGWGPGEGARTSGLIISADQSVGVVSTSGQDDFYAYDLNTGAKLWNKTIPYENMQTSYSWDNANDVFFAFNSVTSQWQGYDIKTGNLKWTSDPIGPYPWGVNQNTRSHAYGMLFSLSYDGHVYAIDDNTGKLKWTSDFTGNTTETVFGQWPFEYNHEAIADGIIYTSTGEHSPTQPRWRGGHLFAIDAYTGKFLWNLSGNIGSNYAGKAAVAYGTYIGTNEYDGTMYAIAKGQTAVTVEAPQTAVAKGNSVLIQGTIMDLSPAQPNTPCISDDCMTAWMNYLHMQEPLVGTMKGVQIVLTATGPDGSTIDLGTTTSTAKGNFAVAWTPPNTGLYWIDASFAGTNSYWSSAGQTSVLVAATPSASVSPSASVTAGQTTTPSQPSETTSNSPSAASSVSVSPSVAPPPSTEAAPSMTLYIAIAAAIIVAVAAAVLFLKRK